MGERDVFGASADDADDNEMMKLQLTMVMIIKRRRKKRRAVGMFSREALKMMRSLGLHCILLSGTYIYIYTITNWFPIEQVFMVTLFFFLWFSLTESLVEMRWFRRDDGLYTGGDSTLMKKFVLPPWHHVELPLYILCSYSLYRLNNFNSALWKFESMSTHPKTE